MFSVPTLRLFLRHCQHLVYSQRIRLLAKSEWYEEYVDYKSLKQVIKGEFPLAKK